MIATNSQTAPRDYLSFSSVAASHPFQHDDEHDIGNVKNFALTSPLLLPGRTITHPTTAGLNPLVDQASYLFSVLGKLKQTASYRQLSKLQKELMQEITTFHEAISHHYHTEYTAVCRYTICAAFDDIIAHTAWGSQCQWDSFSLLAAFNQDAQHEDKFFTILERALKEPTQYIDLMEFIYICLSMGYKGRYRSTEHSQYQLEQVTNHLYRHIRAYRGNFSKTLSPVTNKTANTKIVQQRHVSPLFIVFATACVIMSIFVSLGYLMDAISNEAYKHIEQIKSPLSNEVSY